MSDTKSHIACEAAGKMRGTRDAMIAHLVKDCVRNCKNASDKAVNMALSIKFPTENLIVMLATCPSLNSHQRN
jgi:hypothetical protein